MAVVIRMKRTGRKNRPSYRISATNARNARDGRTLETLGTYDPASPVEALRLKLVPERIQYWVSQGARLSPTVAAILRKQKIVAPKVQKKRDRSGRKKANQGKAYRKQRKTTTAAAKAARFKARVAAKKAAAKAAAPAAGATT
ncbi:MAG: 30S ribosomal protein S16 [Planctomycetota bacterium]